jgi:Protein of unknown function (DUF2855)
MADLTELHVNRSSIGETRLVELPLGDLADGHIRLQVEHYALTANNITYAQFGDMLDYWNFFPVASDDHSQWGKVPAMGWAQIIESKVAGLEVGGRYYGWFPMATTVDIQGTPSSAGFRDDGSNRSKHAGAYRSFVRTDTDGLYTSAEDEHRHELLRGLYITGFLIDYFFVSQSYLGVQQAIVMSASSKTALGYATRARETSPHIRLVGVTSAANRMFVENTGAYDQLVTYEELDVVDSVPSVIIDMAGSGAAVAALHARLGDHIAHSMVVGKSHHEAAPAMVTGGPQPAMFFAPTSMDVCLAEWGAEGYAERTRSGLAAFIENSKSWMTTSEHRGTEAAQAAWHTLFSGAVEPSTGMIASLNG